MHISKHSCCQTAYIKGSPRAQSAWRRPRQTCPLLLATQHNQPRAAAQAGLVQAAACWGWTASKTTQQDRDLRGCSSPVKYEHPYSAILGQNTKAGQGSYGTKAPRPSLYREAAARQGGATWPGSGWGRSLTRPPSTRPPPVRQSSKQNAAVPRPGTALSPRRPLPSIEHSMYVMRGNNSVFASNYQDSFPVTSH